MLETNPTLSEGKKQGRGTKSTLKHSPEKLACLGWAKVALSLRVPRYAFSGATMEKLLAECQAMWRQKHLAVQAVFVNHFEEVWLLLVTPVPQGRARPALW